MALFLWISVAIAWTVASGQTPLKVNITDVPVAITQDDLDCTSTPPPSSPILWQLNVQESGLGVSVIVNRTQLDPDIDDYLLLSADPALSATTEASVAYISGNLTDVKLAIPLTQTAYLQFVSNNPCNENISFFLTLFQYEEAVPEPLPTLPNPFPPTNIKTQILVYLAGKTLDEFFSGDSVVALKDFLYLEVYNFTKTQNIEGVIIKAQNETVFLDKIQQCSHTWDDYKSCVELAVALYVTPPEGSYELTPSHLEMLWDQVCERGLPQSIGLQCYQFDDISTPILWWILWLTIAVVATLGLGFIAWRYIKRIEINKQRLIEEERSKEIQEIFSQVTLRKPDLRLSKHQKVPRYVLNNSENVSVISDPTAPATIAPSAAMKPILKITSFAESSDPAEEARPSYFFYKNNGFEEDEEEEDESEEEISQFHEF